MLPAALSLWPAGEADLPANEETAEGSAIERCKTAPQAIAGRKQRLISKTPEDPFMFMGAKV